MSLITVQDLTFSYDGSPELIFDHVSFRLDTDWKTGVIGRNGRGKTTLLKLLQGAYTYRGSIASPGRFLYFPFPVKAENTRRLALSLAPEAEEWELLRELAQLEVREDVLERPFETLSHGERTKVLLACLFLREGYFLLIDEPTNHLDGKARETVSRYLNSKRGFLLVSHDRMFVDGCTNHILSINRSDIELIKGNFSTWQENRERRDLFEKREDEKLRQNAKRLAQAARRASGWAMETESAKLGTRNSGLRPDRGFIGHKSAKMMKRAKAVESRRRAALEEAEGLLKNIETAEELSLKPLRHPKSRLIELTGVEISYRQKTKIGPVSFTVEQGDRVALSGCNGTGKSSVLKLICGEDDAFSYKGTLILASGLQLSYVPQDASFLRGDLRELCQLEGLDEAFFKALLRKLDFSREQFDRPMESFSEGQKKKVLLARSLAKPAHCYIWDEPFNYVDVLSRMQIEKMIKMSAATMVFVEHDRAFQTAAATKTIEL